MNNIQLSHFIKILNKNLSYGKEMTPGQGMVIRFLKIHDGISTKELASVLNIKVPSLNELLNKLENKGLVYKESSPDDKRVLLVKLTEKGRNYKFKAPKNIDVFDCLDDDERENFEKTLIKLNTEFFNRFKAENPEKFNQMQEKRREIFEKYFKDKNINFADFFDD